MTPFMTPFESGMNITVAIITAPRRINTIDRSLASFFEQKSGIIPYVFAEPGSEKFYHKHQVKLRVNPVRRGCFYNWWYAALHILQRTRSDYVLMCEDDVQWSRYGYQTLINGTSKKIVRTAWTPNVNATLNVEGWHPTANLDRYGLCGSLALLIPRKILGDIVSNRNMTKVNRIHLDTDIGFALQDLRIPIFSHHPSLVTHIGAYNSTFDLSVVGEETIDARRCYASCTTRRR